jgi:hypothetical protein
MPEDSHLTESEISQHSCYSLYHYYRRPEDWTLSWSGSGTIYGWGHNHRGQLGGVEGAKVKLPTPCEALSALRPVQLLGGEQTLMAVTADGKVYATGKDLLNLYRDHASLLTHDPVGCALQWQTDKLVNLIVKVWLVAPLFGC